MLIRLFGRNFRSLKEPFELSMVAADLTRKEDRSRGVIEIPIRGMEEPLNLLRVAAIYGPNASGKSTILMAGHALSWLVTESSKRAQVDAPIPPFEPFALDKASPKRDVELGCDIAFQNQVLRYEIKFSLYRITQESLSTIDGNRQQSLIERKINGEITGELIKHNEANQLYVKGMQPNVAVLSKLAQHGPQSGKGTVQPFFRAIRDSLRYNDYSSFQHTISSVTGPNDERLADDESYRRWVLEHLIRPADIGIRGVLARKEEMDIPDFLRTLAKKNRRVQVPDESIVVSFVHDGESSDPIEFRFESMGTKKLMTISSDWWTLSHEMVTLFADELDASLHPLLLRGLVTAANASPRKKGVNSQLIFTTHDTGLLESQDGQQPVLRRDQVYFAKKSSKGASELYSLTEFKEGARPVHNIRKRYLSGLYGAIPSLERFSR